MVGQRPIPRDVVLFSDAAVYLPTKEPAMRRGAGGIGTSAEENPGCSGTGFGHTPVRLVELSRVRQDEPTRPACA